MRDPVRTIKRAAPLAVFAVSAVYLFINVAYFSVVSKTDILESRRIVAYVDHLWFKSFGSLILQMNAFSALYFRNIFGPTTEKAR